MTRQPGLWACVELLDAYLDENVAQPYKDEPLAQDWARVAKVIEEVGEAIAELIAYTGQNPRKPQRPEARAALLEELADVALTAIYGLQHFTKDIHTTQRIVKEKSLYHCGRVHLLPETPEPSSERNSSVHMGKLSRS